MIPKVKPNVYGEVPLWALLLDGWVNLAEMVIPMRVLRRISPSADYNWAWTALLGLIGLILLGPALVVLVLLRLAPVLLRLYVYVCTPFRPPPNSRRG